MLPLLLMITMRDVDGECDYDDTRMVMIMMMMMMVMMMMLLMMMITVKMINMVMGGAGDDEATKFAEKIMRMIMRMMSMAIIMRR
jgi:nitrogen fixation/metabolism regulation signal transduction histidine kinase